MKLQTNADTAMLVAPNMVNPRTIAPTTPTAAPLDKPIMPGSARGFLKTPCSEAPATPKLPPAKMPMTTRGRRMFQRIASVRGSNEAPFSIPAWLSRIERLRWWDLYRPHAHVCKQGGDEERQHDHEQCGGGDPWRIRASACRPPEHTQRR